MKFDEEPFKYVRKVNSIENDVETLEEVNNELIIPKNASHSVTTTSKLYDNDVAPFNEITTSENTTQKRTSSERKPHKQIITLQKKHLSFSLEQTRVTYQALFADYFKDATEITIEAPSIRTSWQVKNSMKFQTMSINTNDVYDRKVHLVTSEDEDYTPDLIDKSDDMIGYDIKFDYNFHGRCIKTDIDCMVSKRRKLDIYKKYNLYSAAVTRLDKQSHSLKINSS